MTTLPCRVHNNRSAERAGRRRQPSRRPESRAPGIGAFYISRRGRTDGCGESWARDRSRDAARRGKLGLGCPALSLTENAPGLASFPFFGVNLSCSFRCFDCEGVGFDHIPETLAEAPERSQRGGVMLSGRVPQEGVSG